MKLLLGLIGVIMINYFAVSSNGKTNLMSKSDRVPIVEGLGYQTKVDFFNTGIGFAFQLKTDLYAGYQTDLFYLNSSIDYLVANPVIYLEAAMHSYFELDFIFANYQVQIDLETFRYTPLDLTFLLSISHPDQFCYAL